MTIPEPAFNVAVLVYPGFSEFEVTVAMTLLSEHGQVDTVGLNDHLVRGEGGLRVLPVRTIEDVQVADYQAFLIPGAADISPLVLAPETLPELVAGFAAAGKVVGAICGGASLLGRAGLLKDLPYTVTLTAEQRERLLLPEENFTYQDVVQSGQVITAQGHAFVEFGLAVAQALGVPRLERARHFYSGQGNRSMEAEARPAS